MAELFLMLLRLSACGKGVNYSSNVPASVELLVRLPSTEDAIVELFLPGEERGCS